MKINWKLRLKNKTTLIALATLAVAFVYQVLGLFDIVPSVGKDNVMNTITLLVNILAALGVVVDPTTAGISDSTRALNYEKPVDNSIESEE